MIIPQNVLLWVKNGLVVESVQQKFGLLFSFVDAQFLAQKLYSRVGHSIHVVDPGRGAGACVDYHSCRPEVLELLLFVQIGEVVPVGTGVVFRSQENFIQKQEILELFALPPKIGLSPPPVDHFEIPLGQSGKALLHVAMIQLDRTQIANAEGGIGVYSEQLNLAILDEVSGGQESSVSSKRNYLVVGLQVEVTLLEHQTQEFSERKDIHLLKVVFGNFLQMQSFLQVASVEEDSVEREVHLGELLVVLFYEGFSHN